MGDSYQNARIRDRRFRGAELAQANFAGADLRGADFSGAHLIGCDFSHSRCGLSRWWTGGLLCGAFFAALVCGGVFGFAGAVPSSSPYILTPYFPAAARPFIVVSTILMALAPVAALLRRGIFVALGVFAVLTALVALGGALVPSPEYTALNLVILMAIGGSLAAVVALAGITAIMLALGGKWYATFIIGCAGLAAAPAMVEGIRGVVSSPASGQQDPAAAVYLVGVGFLAGFLGASWFVARKALASDPRFAFVRQLATGILTRGGTKFRGADLTGCNFRDANLDHADLREAKLTHAVWLGATHLERARVEHTCFQQPPVRQLAVTGEGKEQNYDDLDLQGLNLAGMRLAGASFIGANLIGAILRGADLAGAKLTHALLYDADLAGSCLTGAYIEDWGISSSTQFDGIECAYIYMRLPTKDDPDPQRKPDNRNDEFAPGDFVDFIKPIAKTLGLYHRPGLDLRTVASAFKTLDLFQSSDVDPLASAVALTQLAQRHPDADLQLVTVEGRGTEKLRLQTAVMPDTDRSVLSKDFEAIYREVSALPREELTLLAAALTHKDERIRQLENWVRAASEGNRFYMETLVMFGAPVRSVLFAANPLDTDRLRLDVEIREIMAKVQESKYRDVIEILPMLAARPQDVQQALNRYRPQIVHFSGHGNGSEIILEDEQGAQKPLSTAALVSLFTTSKDNIRLVILNACYAQNQAEAIIGVIDTAIGMNEAITDDAAIIFVAAFYRALAHGLSIKTAFDQGITSLLLEGIEEESTPQLLVRQGVDPAAIVLVAPREVPDSSLAPEEEQ